MSNEKDGGKKQPEAPQKPAATPIKGPAQAAPSGVVYKGARNDPPAGTQFNGK